MRRCMSAARPKRSSSEPGSRQGTTSGPVFFCLAIQPFIDEANALDGVRVLAYMDDVTILANSVPLAIQAFRIVQRGGEAIVNLRKCEARNPKTGATRVASPLGCA